MTVKELKDILAMFSDDVEILFPEIPIVKENTVYYHHDIPDRIYDDPEDYTNFYRYFRASMNKGYVSVSEVKDYFNIAHHCTDRDYGWTNEKRMYVTDITDDRLYIVHFKDATTLR